MLRCPLAQGLIADDSLSVSFWFCCVQEGGEFLNVSWGSSEGAFFLVFGETAVSLRLEVGNLSRKSGMHPRLLESVCDRFCWTLAPGGCGDEMDILLSLSSVFYSSNMALASSPQPEQV